MCDQKLVFPENELVCLVWYRTGKLEALLSCESLNGKTMGEWCSQVAEIARTSNDENTLIELADYHLYGHQRISRALLENPATTLKVVETAIRNICSFREDSWAPTCKADLQEWEAKRARLLDEACVALNAKFALI